MKKYLFLIVSCCLISLASAEEIVDTSESLSITQVEKILNESATPLVTSSAPIVQAVIKKPLPMVIGLALGGGAAKGFAHIGVIKALEENGIKAQVVTGTSAGSLVGSLYAYGYNATQLQQISYQMDELSLADFTLSADGVLKGNRLQQFIDARVKNTPLQKLKICCRGD